MEWTATRAHKLGFATPIRFALSVALVLFITTVSAFSQSAADGVDTDMGYPLLTGTASVNGGTVTINGSGSDIWLDENGPITLPVECNYFRWAITGDGSITARVLSLTNTDQYAKAGLMLSDSPAGESFNTTLAYVIPSGQAAFFNTTTSLRSVKAPYFPFHFPVWLRLSRTNGLNTGYASEDGITWTPLVSAPQPPGSDQVVVGLAVTSHNPQELATAVFDNISFTGNVTPLADFAMSVDPLSQTVAPGSPVNLTIATTALNGFASTENIAALRLPAGWSYTQAPTGVSVTPPETVPFSITTAASTPPGSYRIPIVGGSLRPDAVQKVNITASVSGTLTDPGAGSGVNIGNPPQPGSAVFSGGVLKLQASGYISANPDSLFYYYWHLTGDGSITARLTSLCGKTSASKAGLMLRESLDPFAQYAMASAPILHGGQIGYQLENRDTRAGIPVIGPFSYHTAPFWMRLIRSGSLITIHWSLDGITWELDAPDESYNVRLTDPVLIGIAADTDAVFDNITVTGNVQP